MSGLDDLVKGVSGDSSSGGGLGDILGGLTGSGSSGGGGLGDILGGILGGGGKGSSGAPASASSGLGGMLTALLPMLGGLLAGGGLQKILGGLKANGLSAEADSWVGTGENQPVSGAAVRQAVGDDEIARIAQQLGVSDDEAAEAVAQVLPVVVDKVSPDGQLQPDDALSSAFDNLKQFGG